jgi:hypothetical protein
VRGRTSSRAGPGAPSAPSDRSDQDRQRALTPRGPGTLRGAPGRPGPGDARKPSCSR